MEQIDPGAVRKQRMIGASLIGFPVLAFLFALLLEFLFGTDIAEVIAGPILWLSTILFLPGAVIFLIALPSRWKVMLGNFLIAFPLVTLGATIILGEVLNLNFSFDGASRSLLESLLTNFIFIMVFAAPALIVVGFIVRVSGKTQIKEGA